LREPKKKRRLKMPLTRGNLSKGAVNVLIGGNRPKRGGTGFIFRRKNKNIGKKKAAPRSGRPTFGGRRVEGGGGGGRKSNASPYETKWGSESGPKKEDAQRNPVEKKSVHTKSENDEGKTETH